MTDNDDRTYPFTTTSYEEAVLEHEESGGFLLNLGWEKDHSVYAVCDEETATDIYGRTREHLLSLAPSYRERQ
jgi:hypothetical protein